jgi:hypothetical protein
LIGSGVETGGERERERERERQRDRETERERGRRFQATGKLNSTRTAPPLPEHVDALAAPQAADAEPRGGRRVGGGAQHGDGRHRDPRRRRVQSPRRRAVQVACESENFEMRRCRETHARRRQQIGFSHDRLPRVETRRFLKLWGHNCIHNFVQEPHLGAVSRLPVDVSTRAMVPRRSGAS